MKSLYLFKFSLTLLMALAFLFAQAQTGNRVFSGAEMTNFGTINLPTPTGKTWATDRLSTPGYFSATNGAVYSGASDADNINGYVKKYGNQAFTFPVGTGTDLRTLSISAPGNTTDAYATAWILGDPSGNLDPTGPNGGPHDITATTFPIYAVSNVGQWDWQTGIDMGTTGDGVGLTITISIPDMTAFALTVRLRVVGWNGSSWVDLSGWHTASGNTENSTITGTMIAGISAIGIGSTYWVLPLKLLSFKASEKDCAAILNWSTAEEQNTSYFEIEQSSNGNLFSKAGVVNAKGGSNNNTYAFTTSQTTGESYYRLKMIDKDGSYSYSPVEYVKINCTASTNFINVYPNPSKEGFVYINFNTGITGAAKIALLNSVGQQIITKDITVVAGNNLIKFEMNKIPKGLYFIKLISADNKIIFQPQKVIVE